MSAPTPPSLAAAEEIDKVYNEAQDSVHWPSFESIASIISRHYSDLERRVEKMEKMKKENKDLQAQVDAHEAWIKGPPSLPSEKWTATPPVNHLKP